ncbi:FMN-dependent NADH-azoreductase [Niveispirillum fermenti]|uniref:FMN-dependent NADH-azoreductase n=1 Tax=Niveispirillum fermenti TaxID=1233113 RepID=UPI003A8B5354
MTTILVIESSANGDSSVSGLLVKDALRDLLAAHPGARIIHRDLGASPVPHVTTANLAGVRGEPVTETEKATRTLSDTLVAELKAADIILMGVPMYNFSVPTVLRSWFDHVLRAGLTFSYTEAGPKGLLDGKRAIVIEARGGLYSEGPAQAIDFQEPYLRQLFGFTGITDVTFVHAEKIGFGPEARAAAIDGARAKLAGIIASLDSKAA